MPAKVTLNTVAGALLDLQAASGRIIQTGTMTDIPSSVDSDASILIAAVGANGMPVLGVSFYPNTSLVFTRLQVHGFSTNGVALSLYYESPSFLIPTAYIIRDHSSMSSQTATYDFKTGNLLAVSYAGDATLGNPPPSQTINGDSGKDQLIPALIDVLCPTDVLLPVREITVTQISVGQPAIAGRDLFGTVNDASWPGSQDSSLFNGTINTGTSQLYTTPPAAGNPLPIGYWLFNRMESDWTKFSNYYQTEIGAISFVNHDWSQILVARDPSTGLYVKPTHGANDPFTGMPFPNETPPLQALLSKPYSYGLDRDDMNGIARWGPYPTVSFKTIFGF